MKKENQKEILEKLERKIIELQEKTLTFAALLREMRDYFSNLEAMICYKPASLIHGHFANLLSLLYKEMSRLESELLDLTGMINKEIEKINNHE